MKLTLVLLLLATFLVQATKADTNIVEVCHEIVTKRPSLTDSCRRLSAGKFDEGALRVSLQALKSNPSIALQVLQTAQGRSVDRVAAGVCEEYAYFHPWNAGPCIDAISNRKLSTQILRIARQMIQKKNGRLALDILAWRDVTELNPKLSMVCEEVAARSPELAEKCVRTILGRKNSQGVESCQSADQSGEEKIDCLAGLKRYGERAPASLKTIEMVAIRPPQVERDEVGRLMRTQTRVRYRNGPAGNLDALVMP